MNASVECYLIVGCITAPFFLWALRLSKRQRFVVVLILWAIVALIWPFALLDLVIFTHPEDRW